MTAVCGWYVPGVVDWCQSDAAANEGFHWTQSVSIAGNVSIFFCNRQHFNPPLTVYHHRVLGTPTLPVTKREFF